MDSTLNRLNQQLLDAFNTFVLFPSSRSMFAEAGRGVAGWSEEGRRSHGGVNPRDFGHRSSNRNVPSLAFHESALLMSRLYSQIETSSSPAWEEDRSELHKGISWQA